MNQNTDQIDALQQAIGDSIEGNPPASNHAHADLNATSAHSRPTKIDGLIDSILAKFPLNHPVTLVFAGCKTDAETDSVTTSVARRLAERHVGKVLLIDANQNSQKLSSDLGFEKLAGIGNVVCADQPWQSCLQSADITGLDCLPYGNVSTAKTMRSRTQNFVADAKTDYQFICVSTGSNDTPISKSFCDAADGIYLLVDLVHLTHLEAKAAADKFILKKLPLVGCIALDAEQEQQ